MTENNNPLTAHVSRRSVIMGAAAVAGAVGFSGILPKSLAAAAAAEPAPFDLSQVKHVVYVMQENRSFDHYFGTFPNARGFDDPTAITLGNGNSVFRQPDASTARGYLEPFHMDTEATGAAAIPSLSHDWRDQHASWNKGAMDGWLSTHVAADGDTKGSYTMGYMEQSDIPFHWALATKFTLADNYHCSVLGPTFPNRAVWMSGTNDPQGLRGGPILETVAPNTLTWPSAAEVLYDAGYTVKTYSSSGSYNYFSWWQNFKAKGLVDDALYNRIMTSGTLFGNGTPNGVGDALSPTKAETAYLGFEQDCANGTLADVTWLFPDGPYASDEHPPHTPAAGAYFLASKLEALAANPELWNSTVFIINYDENDGFFDHVPPPVPDEDLYPEEFVSMPSPKGTPGGGLPVGAGFRVPCLIISPWTVGGHIYSQVSDHTSPLQLIEAVTAVGGLNSGTPTKGLAAKQPVLFEAISPWRRATFDDFTDAFHPDAQPAPSDAEFSEDTREANYQAQLEASSQPMPTRPGASQTTPHQEPAPAVAAAAAPSSAASTTTTGAAAAAVSATAATTAAGTAASSDVASASQAQTPVQAQAKSSAATSAASSATAVRSTVKVTETVTAGQVAKVAVTGAAPGTAVIVRTARGKLATHGSARTSGRVSLSFATSHIAAGHHGYTVMFTDAAGRHHTKNVKILVKPKHRK